MPREGLTDGFVAALMARETGTVCLFLLDITHEDMDETIRIVNNTEDVVSGGNTYTAVGFDLRLPDERDTAPRGATLSIDNTTQWLTPTLRTLFGEFEVTIKVATASDINADPPEFDNIEFEYLPLQLTSVEIDATTVRGNLNYENLANQNYPGDVFSPWEFQGLYR
jgi:hypothetical protein